jgi:hypothetical protein
MPENGALNPEPGYLPISPSGLAVSNDIGHGQAAGVFGPRETAMHCTLEGLSTYL